MPDYERKPIRHHYGKEPWESPAPSSQARPGMYPLAAACLDNTLVVAVPFKVEGLSFLLNWTPTIPQATCVLPADPAHSEAVVCRFSGLEFLTKGTH